MDCEKEFLLRLEDFYKEQGISFVYGSEFSDDDTIEIIVGGNCHFLIQREFLRGKIDLKDIAVELGIVEE